jgi:predicted transcriptional regulator
MAMTLRLSEDEAAALREYAKLHDVSMQEAAREAIRQLVHNERRDTFSRMIRERDRELLDRLAQ